MIKWEIKNLNFNVIEDKIFLLEFEFLLNFDSVKPWLKSSRKKISKKWIKM